jgi:hypothetical protein
MSGRARSHPASLSARIPLEKVAALWQSAWTSPARGRLLGDGRRITGFVALDRSKRPSIRRNDRLRAAVTNWHGCRGQGRT